MTDIPPLRGVQGCVFDAYGTLFDFAAAARNCRDVLGDDIDRLGSDGIHPPESQRDFHPLVGGWQSLSARSRSPPADRASGLVMQAVS